MKKEIIETGFCPICHSAWTYGGILRFDNYYKNVSDVISQEVECTDCAEKFEVVFAPIEILKIERKKK